MSEDARDRPVAYLLKRFPRLSETFILHEILGLERAGVRLAIYSIMDPEEKVVHADVARLSTKVEYFPRGVTGFLRIAVAHFSLLLSLPARYLSTLLDALLRRRLTALKHFMRAGWIADRLRGTDARHLHAHFAHGPASVAHFASMLSSVPFSFTAHAKDIYTSPPDLLGAKIRAARFVVTCTEYNARHLTSLAGDAAQRIKRIYHGVDLEKFRPCCDRDRMSASDLRVLAIGRLVEKKGFTYLVDAVRSLTSVGRRLHLRIVGGGELKPLLERQIAQLGLDGVVELVGPRPQEQVVELYRSADVFVLPCVVTDNGDRDGIPNVLVEAMRMGVPVVSTAISGIPELVIDGTTGLLVPPRDVPSLVKAIERLADNPEERRSLSARAADHVSKKFDLCSNVDVLKSLLLAESM
jgi:glycosyltransferase involved in cell wall biosynthesis